MFSRQLLGAHGGPLLYCIGFFFISVVVSIFLAGFVLQLQEWGSLRTPLLDILRQQFSSTGDSITFHQG